MDVLSYIQFIRIIHALRRFMKNNYNLLTQVHHHHKTGFDI
jgi:hypothetical protein